MAFVNWLEDVCNPLGCPEKVDRPPSDAFCWVHPVTGSCYYLEREKAAEITNAGLAWSEVLIKEKGHKSAAEQLSCLFAQRDVFSRKQYLKESGFDCESAQSDASGIPPVALWPELPYPGCSRSFSGWIRGEKKDCVRLADFLLLRTGLFYALAAEQVQREDWSALSLTSLLDGCEIYAGGKGLSFLAPIPERLQDAYTAASLLAGYPEELVPGITATSWDHLPPLELVVGGAFKVKEYYLETNRIGEIRGASVLLDDINRKRFFRMFRELPGLTGASLIYAGGGHLLAVVPAGKGEMVAGEIERLYREVCLTARAVGVSCRVHAAELSDFSSLNRRLNDEIVDRRSVLIPAWDAEKGDIELYADGSLNVSSFPLPDAGGRWCDSCGIRPAVKQWKYEDEERPLCASCLRKQIVGQSARKTVFAADYREFWEARGVQADLPAAQEISEIADSNEEIAVIYADGNNFGSLFGQCNSLAHLRMLSQFTENAAYTAAFTAIKEHQALLDNGAVEIIALGGDDAFIIVPAQAALPLAVAIGKCFDRLFKNLSEGKAGPTLSVGVIIAGAKTPVRYLFEVAQALLKEAKKRAYRDLAKGELKEGTLDIAVLASYGAYEDNITVYRSETFCKNGVKLTLRPYTFTQAENLMKALCRLQTSREIPGRSWFYGLRQAAVSYGMQVANLFFNYQFSRLPEAQQKALRNCWHILTGQHGDPAMFCEIEEIEGSSCCPWIDVVELWNYVGSGGESS
ncbi:CRISPR-associated hydrolase of the HD superfamily [Thermacetogenium phaeum DSM 12270]|uniref:CRISPR-associated hydrolase of the HD superfamily n=1 Tax=Thermacetogenium phaeum (strain ATCC BAA-254 / DSM 26808 / PB) TaxID=1089553 RepID=K4LKL9_THEPS|nr:CRISPR-associated hydrolase of the HD superfamily [Thermacetogenium phaeum]AFV12632.1 CRISPR-associated hydrolase of the HD superfamily [Thermacetogenium phaeum DSM 12270]